MDVVKICEVVDGCKDCPKYGDDCDGDEMTEHTDLISRADAIDALSRSSVYAWSTEQDLVAHSWAIRILQSLPSANAVGEKENDGFNTCNNNNNNVDVDYKSHIRLIGNAPSADAVPTVIRAKTFMRKEDFDKWAEDIKKQNKSIVCIPCDAEVVSADAVQGWRIGKPTEQGEYMVTIDSFGYKHIDLFYYGKPMMPNRKVRGKCWYRSDDEWGDVVYDDKDIIAWIPLPKPYKGGDEE